MVLLPFEMQIQRVNNKSLNISYENSALIGEFSTRSISPRGGLEAHASTKRRAKIHVNRMLNTMEIE